jgi:hypothetical protein
LSFAFAATGEHLAAFHDDDAVVRPRHALLPLGTVLGEHVALDVRVRDVLADDEPATGLLLARGGAARRRRPPISSSTRPRSLLDSLAPRSSASVARRRRCPSGLVVPATPRTRKSVALTK